MATYPKRAAWLSKHRLKPIVPGFTGCLRFEPHVNSPNVIRAFETKSVGIVFLVDVVPDYPSKLLQTLLREVNKRLS